MTNVVPMPLAAMLGATHVSIAQTSNRWAAIAWERATGPQMIGKPGSYQEIKARAKAFADRVGAVLDLPTELGRIDVQRCPDGQFQVMHVSASENSMATLRTFGPHERDEAVRYALSVLPQYQPCRLGEVAPWVS